MTADNKQKKTHMIEELIFTSARRGLQIGKSGFCTVASTSGMSAPVARLLENLSGYRHLFPPGSPEAVNNPVGFSHLTTKLGGREYHILSRIADAGFDYSNRSNKLAHHIAIQNPQLIGGPPTLLLADNLLVKKWDQEPTKLPPRSLSIPAVPPKPCAMWAEVTGDAGWAGTVIEAIQQNRVVYLIIEPTTPAAVLLHELVSLFPVANQWQITFSTFFTKLPPSVECQLRCVIAGSPEVAIARRSPANFVLDLTASLGLSTGKFITAARNGETIGADTTKRAAHDEKTDGAQILLENSANIEPNNDPNLDLDFNLDLNDDDSNVYELSDIDQLPPNLRNRAAIRHAQTANLLPPDLNVNQRIAKWIAIAAAMLLVPLIGGAIWWAAQRAITNSPTVASNEPNAKAENTKTILPTAIENEHVEKTSAESNSDLSSKTDIKTESPTLSNEAQNKPEETQPASKLDEPSSGVQPELAVEGNPSSLASKTNETRMKPKRNSANSTGPDSKKAEPVSEKSPLLTADDFVPLPIFETFSSKIKSVDLIQLKQPALDSRDWVIAIQCSRPDLEYKLVRDESDASTWDVHAPNQEHSEEFNKIGVLKIVTDEPENESSEGRTVIQFVNDSGNYVGGDKNLVFDGLNRAELVIQQPLIQQPLIQYALQPVKMARVNLNFESLNLDNQQSILDNKSKEIKALLSEPTSNVSNVSLASNRHFVTELNASNPGSPPKLELEIELDRNVEAFQEPPTLYELLPVVQIVIDRASLTEDFKASFRLKDLQLTESLKKKHITWPTEKIEFHKSRIPPKSQAIAEFLKKFIEKAKLDKENKTDETAAKELSALWKGLSNEKDKPLEILELGMPKYLESPIVFTLNTNPPQKVFLFVDFNSSKYWSEDKNKNMKAWYTNYFRTTTTVK